MIKVLRLQHKKLLTLVKVFVLCIGSAVMAQPVITSVSPTAVTINTVVTIDGNNFGTTGSVRIGSTTIPAGSILSRNNTKVTLKITAAWSGNVTVTNNATSNSGVSAAVINYVVAAVKDGTHGIKVDEIYTDWNGYWVSTGASNVTANQPNDRHNLLAFKYDGVVYSTGVNDALLTNNLVTFTPQQYRAYSTRGVTGKTHSNLFLAMADLIDGTVHNAVGNPSSPEIQGLSIFDVLIDGENGLDLGTGITNFNQDATISFFSDNAQSGPSNSFISDPIPDVIITQIADPGSIDYYHFSDVNGNIVGTPVRINMNATGAQAIGPVGRYRLDLFTFPNNSDIATASPNANRPVDQRTREIRLVGLKFSDFGINASNISQINTFDMLAGGTADIAFLAYNTSSFAIASPVITSAPNSVRICSLPYPNDVTFSVGAAIQGGGTGMLNYQWKKNNIIIPGATTNTLTIPGPITSSNLATYKVEISNEFGAIVASSAVLRLGGAPVVWNGTSWSSTPTNANSLIFAGNYNSASNLTGTKLEGCDCTVQNNANVVIDSGDTMILQNSLKVAAAIPAHVIPGFFDENSVWIPEQNVPLQPAGTFTLLDDASLIQVSETAENEGVIRKNRDVTNLHQYDYVYWSAPVSGFNLTGLSAYSTLIYQWNPTAVNANSTYGNWVGASGVMSPAKGYIARVNSGNNFQVTFTGAPHNGLYQVPLTGVSNADPDTNYWNLVGNPYPSSIRAIDFINSNTALEGSVRLWTHNSGIGTGNTGDSPYYENFTHNYGDQYVTYNGTASVPPGFNGYIASGQGFFVKGKTTSGTISFQNTFRYKENLPVYNNGQFYRAFTPVESGLESPTTSDAKEKSLLWLSLVDQTNLSVSTAIGYVSGATLEKDRVFDAAVDVEPFTIYSLIGDEPQIIQGRPAPLNAADIVPVGISVPANGVYKIGVDRAEGDFADDDQHVYLEDLYLNVVHDLRTQPYEFSATEGNHPDRFKVRYETQALSVIDHAQKSVYAYIDKQTLHIQSAKGIRSVVVFDLTGKKLGEQIANDVTTYTGTFQFETGVYVASITLQDGTTVTQKLIKN